MLLGLGEVAADLGSQFGVEGEAIGLAEVFDVEDYHVEVVYGLF